MTKREMLEKVFNNEPVEHVPVGFWFHFLNDDQLYAGVQHPEYMEKSYAGHKAYIEAFDPDMVKIMTDGLFSRPANTMPAILEAKDLYHIKPLPYDHEYFQASVRLAKTVRSYTGDDRMMFYNVFSPLFNLDKYLDKSLAEILTYMVEDPDAVKYALDVLGQDMAHLAEIVMTEGTADGIYYSVNDYNKCIPVELYRKLVTPSDLRPLEAANKLGHYNILHICGYHGADNYMELYREYPNQIVNWAVYTEGMSLKEGREFFGGKPIIGGYDQAVDALINTGSKEEIQAFAEGIINEVGKVGIVVGADCTVPPSTPLEHLQWVREKLNTL